MAMSRTSKVIVGIAIAGGVILVVLPILLVLSIPAMQSVIRRANETSAIASIKDIDTQENAYVSEYPQHGFACSLVALGGSGGTPSADFAQLIPEDLASGTKSGYTFEISCPFPYATYSKLPSRYRLTAVPNTPGHTGNRGFCSDETGEIHFDPKGGTNCTELFYQR